MADYCRVYGVIHFMSPAGWLPVHRDQLQAQRSVTSMGKLYLLPGWASTRKAKPNWILLKQETVSGSGISWAICKSAPSSRQITMPAPHHSFFYMPDALPATQPTVPKQYSAWNYAQKKHTLKCKESLTGNFAKFSLMCSWQHFLVQSFSLAIFALL